MFETLRETQKIAKLRELELVSQVQTREKVRIETELRSNEILIGNFGNLVELLQSEKLSFSQNEFYIKSDEFEIEKRDEVYLGDDGCTMTSAANVGHLPGINTPHQFDDGSWHGISYFVRIVPSSHHIVMRHSKKFSLILLDANSSETKLRERFVDFIEKGTIFREFNIYTTSYLGEDRHSIRIPVQKPRIAGGFRDRWFGSDR